MYYVLQDENKTDQSRGVGCFIVGDKKRLQTGS
jgi:hypothetical protein